MMNDTHFQAGAVIVAAGSGRRMGADKVFLPLAGRPLLAWSVDVCQNCDLVSQIVVVLNENNLDEGRKLVAERGWSKIVAVCSGGERRQDSVRQGLKELKRCAWVVIHDGARPFLTPDLIRDGLEAARGTGAATAAVPLKDTIKLGDHNGMVRETLDRQRLWAVQTPQIFRSDIINRAHAEIEAEVSDDATLVERLGCGVKLFLGSYYNMKITTPEDWALAEIMVKDKQANAGRNWP